MMMAMLMVAAGLVLPGVEELNAQAREAAKAPICLGVPGKAPFWNAKAKAFIHPPAFEVAEVAGQAQYRLTLTDERGHTDEWTAEKPWLPIPSDIWDAKKPGYYTLRVGSFERRFYRAAVFKGPYPNAVREYSEAARAVYAAVYRMPQVGAWLNSDEPPQGYDLYCYPAKILSSMIRALVRYAALAPNDAKGPIAIATKMADWMIAHSQKAGTPLEYFPPTYWGDRREVAVGNAGNNMISYPAHAALAYFDLAKATGNAKYRKAAQSIVRTYAKLQEADGTWPLKMRESDGKRLGANRIIPGRYIFGMLDAAGDFPGVAKMRDRAFAFVCNGPVKTWNWDGQFEDVEPLPPYHNLQKGVAVDIALRLFDSGDKAKAREIVDWCEDQFVVWSDPIHHMDWQHWKTPTALEQYEYYTPIDASMADMVRGFSAAYRATGDRLYLAKAKALADNITRHQRNDGTIPTYFDSRKGSDWVNCMVYVAKSLEDLSKLEAKSVPTSN